jgi:hypothetical protein
MGILGPASAAPTNKVVGKTAALVSIPSDLNVTSQYLLFSLYDT